MKTRFFSVVIGLLALVLCGAVMLSYAQQSNENGGASAWSGHRHGYFGHMARELNLTDAQKQQIRTMMQSQRATLRPLMQQLAQNRLAMLNATANGTFDQAKVQALATQQSQITAQLAVQKASIHSQIYNQVLTPDQKAKADQMRQKQVERINARLQKLSQPPGEATAQ
ncbi:MAG TPA: Spy/CpxP family protein refolding chaperone [Candidatus Binatia bacterium]|nr:Spy/CpxP family protein refolding chaperone [Candidatus Binatia bacterium]